MRWSNSALFALQQCGERFRRRYIERDFRPSGVRAKRGTAVHKVASESHMRQLRAKELGQPKEEYLVGALPTEEEAKDVAATAFDAAMGEGCVFSEEEAFVGKEKVAGEQKDAAIAMSSLYVGSVAPRIDPVGVERKVVIRPADSDVEISGIVDLVSEEDDVPDGDGRRIKLGRIEVVNDLKTADRQPQEDAADRSQQLALYALIRTAETGRPPDKVRLRTLVKTRTNKVSAVEQTVRKEPADLEAVAQRLNVAIETVKRGVFVPANPDSWWCSEKYCEFWTDCVFALGRGR
jgi:PD-(D/E)XK nuclease superfamily